MILKDYIRFLYTYNNWANQRLLDACEKLSQAQFLAAHELNGTTLCIRDTLVHAMAAQEAWLARCSGVSPTQLLDPRDFGTLALVREYWTQVEQHTQAYLSALQDDVLNQAVEYKTTKGVPYSNLRWQILMHQANHATQHRSEIALVLSGLGFSPGDMDLLVYMRQ